MPHDLNPFPGKPGVGSYERECKTLYVNYGGAGTLPTDKVGAGLDCAMEEEGSRPACSRICRLRAESTWQCSVAAPAQQYLAPATSLRAPCCPACHSCPCCKPAVPHCTAWQYFSTACAVVPQVRSIVGENFAEWGPIDNIHLVPSKTLAFIR